MLEFPSYDVFLCQKINVAYIVDPDKMPQSAAIKGGT